MWCEQKCAPLPGSDVRLLQFSRCNLRRVAESIEPVSTRLRTSTRKKNQNRKASLLQPADVSQSLCGRSSFHYIHEGRARPVTLAPESCAAKHEVKAWALPARGTEILKSLKRTPTYTPPVSESGRSRNQLCRDLCHALPTLDTPAIITVQSCWRGYRARANAKGRKATLERFPELRAFHPPKPTPAEEEYRALMRISHLSAEDERSLATAAAAVAAVAGRTQLWTGRRCGSSMLTVSSTGDKAGLEPEAQEEQAAASEQVANVLGVALQAHAASSLSALSTLSTPSSEGENSR